jgi:Domain of unknown function (DUF4352)
VSDKPPWGPQDQSPQPGQWLPPGPQQPRGQQWQAPPGQQPPSWGPPAQPQGPWGQQWQQPGGPQYQPYPVGPGGRRARPPGKRHRVRTVILSVVGAFVVLVVIGVALASHSNSPTVNTSPTSTPRAGSTHAAQPAAATAQVGSTISLTGNTPGEKMAVTVVKVFPRAHGSDEFNTPDPGKRFYAVQFRLTDTGSAAYSDAPSNGATVVDSAGQSYQSDLSTVAGCNSFPGTENIAAGSTGLGCVVFQVPRHAKITEVQFTLDSGFANQTGQWKV